MKLAAAACFNVNEGVFVFEKLQKISEGTLKAPTMKLIAMRFWLDSHPASSERLKSLQLLASEHMKDTVVMRQCGRMRGDLSAAGLLRYFMGI